MIALKDDGAKPITMGYERDRPSIFKGDDAICGRDQSGNRLRRMLWRSLALEPKNLIVWLMVNPSYADDKKDDETIKRVMHFTESWGHDGAVVVNLLPVRLKVGDAWAWASKHTDAMNANLKDIEHAALHASSLTVAWGCSANTLERKLWVEKALEVFNLSAEHPDSPGDLWCLKVLDKCQPAHPRPRLKREAHPDDAPKTLWMERQAKGKKFLSN